MALTTSCPNPSLPKSPSPSSSSDISGDKRLKTLIQTFVISHVCRFVRAISKVRSILIHNFKQNQKNLMFYPKKATKNQKKIFFGSFRLHYNWCSSHVVPVPVPDEAHKLFYDSNRNSKLSVGIDHEEPSQLTGYLRWLEEKVDDGNAEKEMNEIDRLADMFIASCHEKFILEKVESYRMFQEMLARGL